MRKSPILLLPLLLAGCGGLPRPFEGDPGATALRLAVPPPSRLAVPTPTAALLPQNAAETFAGAMADDLVKQEVPAIAERVHPGDWRLAMSADLRADGVVPTYTVLNPSGVSQGSVSGAAVSPQAWSQGDPAALRQAAAAAAPDVANLLTAIEASRRQSDPNSLINRPARIYVPDVTGAPGDGDSQLAKQMRLQLPQDGEVVQAKQDGADYIVAGSVRTADVAGGQMRVEIRWSVHDAAGKEAGAVTQINEVPAGSMTPYWGDVALVVAQQAANGVKDVILNQANPLRTNPAAAAIKLPPQPAPPTTKPARPR